MDVVLFVFWKKKKFKLFLSLQPFSTLNTKYQYINSYKALKRGVIKNFAESDSLNNFCKQNLDRSVNIFKNNLVAIESNAIVSLRS
jgi:hypothetical protein